MVQVRGVWGAVLVGAGCSVKWVLGRGRERGQEGQVDVRGKGVQAVHARVCVCVCVCVCVRARAHARACTDQQRGRVAGGERGRAGAE